MIDRIFAILPDWAVSIIFVAIIWYGAHYIFLSDVALRTDIKAMRADTEMSDGFKNCAIPILVNWISKNKIEYALHTSTFSFIPSEETLIARMSTDSEAAVQKCPRR